MYGGGKSPVTRTLGPPTTPRRACTDHPHRRRRIDIRASGDDDTWRDRRTHRYHGNRLRRRRRRRRLRTTMTVECGTAVAYPEVDRVRLPFICGKIFLQCFLNFRLLVFMYNSLLHSHLLFISCLHINTLHACYWRVCMCVGRYLSPFCKENLLFI